MKWESLLRRSENQCGLYRDGSYSEEIAQLPNGGYTIKTPRRLQRTRRYALYNLAQERLSHTDTGGVTRRKEIRKMAEDIGLMVAHKPDSQEISFVPDNDYAKFIDETTGVRSQSRRLITAEAGSSAVTGESHTHTIRSVSERARPFDGTSSTSSRRIRPETERGSGRRAATRVFRKTLRANRLIFPWRWRS